MTEINNTEKSTKIPNAGRTNTIEGSIKTVIVNEKIIIVIDPGHGGMDPGTIFRTRNGKKTTIVTEKEIARQISKILKEQLDQSKNYTIYTTRDLIKDDYVHDYNEDGLVGYETDVKDYRADTRKAKIKSKKPEQRATLEDRAALANEKEADLFISIHVNASEDGNAKGMLSVIHKGMSGDIKNKTEKLSNILKEKLANKNYTVTHFKQLKWLHVIAEQVNSRPGLILETGFLTNEEDRKNLQKSEYQLGIASATKEAIDEYFAEK